MNPSFTRTSARFSRRRQFLGVLQVAVGSWFVTGAATGFSQRLVNDRYTVEQDGNAAVQITAKDSGTWTFRADFTVLIAERDPNPAMRPANIPHVPYNVVTWRAPTLSADAALRTQNRSTAQTGDGFDDRILKGDTQQRTADVFAAAPAVRMSASGVTRAGNALRFSFPTHEAFELSAELSVPPGDMELALTFTLEP